MAARKPLSSSNAGITADPPAPIVSAILKDENGIESPEGLLPRAVLNQDLEVTVPAWNFSTDPTLLADIVDVGWQLVGAPFNRVRRFRFDIPIAPGDKSVTVPVVELKHGIYDLSYKLIVGGNDIESLRTLITVDRIPPNDNQEPVALEMLGVPGDIITDEYLTLHGEVRFKVQRYLDCKARDRAIYYWTNTSTPSDTEIPIREQAFSQDDIDNDRLIITMTETDIRDRLSGPRWIYYRLRDWAGNLGPRSVLLPVFVILIPAPGALLPPRVPLSARRLIDRQHAREGAVNQGGVTVEIDEYDFWDLADQVLVDWDGTALALKDVAPGRFPLSIDVSWSSLTANGLGPLNARVTYQVLRSSVPTPPSLGTVVPVNLTVAGQDHSNAPALLNTTLALVEVYGANSGMLNELNSDDFGEPAAVLVSLFDNPQPGEKLQLHWGAIAAPVAEYEVQPGDTAGKTVSLSVLWSDIQQDLQNPALPVWYTTTNGVNLQQSRVTSVTVSMVIIRDLKAPSFPHANRDKTLDCCACPRLWQGVWVKVEGNAAFAEHDKVLLYWQGCWGPNGTDPIPGTDAVFETILTNAQATNGFEVHVDDYARLIEPMVYRGSALCYYVLRKTNGAGVGVSGSDFVVINRTMAGNEICSPAVEVCDTPCNP